MAIGLGSSTPTDFALGGTQVDSIYLGSDLVWPPPVNIFIGNGSGSVPNQATLEGKLSGETVTFFRVKGVDVQAVTSTNYSINISAFNGSNLISYIDGGKCTGMNANAFYTSSITLASFPSASAISNATFFSCSALTSIDFPNVSTIGTNAFYRCTSLTSASFPLATGTGTQTFYQCLSLTQLNFPVATTIGTNAFIGCTSLVTASFPSVTSVGTTAFNTCTSLKQINLPALSGSNALGGSPTDNSIFTLASLNGTGSFPSFYSSSNAGSPDGDIAYLSSSRGWLINWL